MPHDRVGRVPVHERGDRTPDRIDRRGRGQPMGLGSGDARTGTHGVDRSQGERIQGSVDARALAPVGGGDDRHPLPAGEALAQAAADAQTGLDNLVYW